MAPVARLESSRTRGWEPDTRPEPGDDPVPDRWTALQADLAVVLPSWLAARVFVALGYLLAVAVLHHYAPGGHTQPLTDQLMAWDGTFYRDIAAGGYHTLPAESLRFFPLFPLLGRFLSGLFLGNESVALLVLANGCSLAAAVVLRRLVLFETNDKALAERAVWLTALFPAAFVLAWGYGEGLALLLVISAFLALRTGRWEIAAVLGLLAALTRPTGVLLAAPFAIEAVRGFTRVSMTERLARLLAIVAPVAGLVLYLGWVGRRFGDFMLPFSVQNSLRGEQVNPITRLARGFLDLFGPERFGDGLHIPFAIAFILLLVVVFRRWPLSYAVFATLGVLAALSADNLNSLERYGLNTFPLILAIATITAKQRWERLALAVSASGLVSLTALAWLAIYVP